MKSYQATIKLEKSGYQRTLQTQVRAMSLEDARWILWALFGFHSILIGPTPVR